MASNPVLRVVTSLADIPPAAWNALAGDNPFVSYEFLSALENTGCVGGDSGWQPCFITLRDNDTLCAAMPLYAKTNSFGEFVFDWAWARAYQQHGMPYYPKLVCAAPFSPVRGPRLIAPTPELRSALLKAAIAFAQENALSSLHILFPPEETLPELEAVGLMMRSSVQFHWRNQPYQDFDAFLSTLSHDKRKKIKQERRKVRDAGVSFRWRSGSEATEAEWDFFYDCYVNTYRQHASSPYLTREFFAEIALRMPQQVLLIIATRNGADIACALNIHNSHTLFGRYWGATEFVSGLHFEACYYQSIEFCIARGIQVFEGGAQGEHKLARGMLPVRTQSAHWIAHPAFAQAIEGFLQQEGSGMEQYVDELNEHSPFKRRP